MGVVKSIVLIKHTGIPFHTWQTQFRALQERGKKQVMATTRDVRRWCNSYRPYLIFVNEPKLAGRDVSPFLSRRLVPGKGMGVVKSIVLMNHTGIPFHTWWRQFRAWQERGKKQIMATTRDVRRWINSYKS